MISPFLSLRCSLMLIRNPETHLREISTPIANDFDPFFVVFDADTWPATDVAPTDPPTENSVVPFLVFAWNRAWYPSMPYFSWNRDFFISCLVFRAWEKSPPTYVSLSTEYQTLAPIDVLRFFVSFETDKPPSTQYNDAFPERPTAVIPFFVLTKFAPAVNVMFLISLCVNGLSLNLLFSYDQLMYLIMIIQPLSLI